MIQDLLAGLLLAVATYGVRTLTALRRDIRRDRRRMRRWLTRHDHALDQHDERLARIEQFDPMPRPEP